jgi:transcriptional regulator with XRE-family HTH domain
MKPTLKKITQREIAKSVKIGPDFLSHIIRGRRRCPPAVALRLEELTGISRVTWVWGTPEEIREAVQEYIAPQRGEYGH